MFSLFSTQITAAQDLSHFTIFRFLFKNSHFLSVLSGIYYCGVFPLSELIISSPLKKAALAVVITSSCRTCKMQILVGPSSVYSLWSRIFFVVVKIVSGFHSNKFIHLPVFFPSFMTLPQRLNFIYLMFLELCPFIFLEQSHFEKSLRLFVAFGNKSRGIFFFLPRGSQRDFKLYESLTCIDQTVPPLSFKVHFTEAQATSVACFRGILTSAATWSSVHMLTRHCFRMRASR